MRKLTPQRRAAVVLASCASFAAASPVLLANNLHGRGHDYFFGIATGLAVGLLIASAILLRRSRCSTAL